MAILKFGDYRLTGTIVLTPETQETTETQPDENPNEKFGCLMVNFAFTNWSEFIRRQVNQSDIYLDETDPINNYGYEDEPHCTVLFGLNHGDDIVENLKKILPPLEEINDILRGDMSIFESEKYDILKFDLSSEKLSQLNANLKANFKNSDQFDEYKPHITIAYIQKGKGINYTKDNLQKVPLFPSEYIYSDPEQNKTLILI